MDSTKQKHTSAPALLVNTSRDINKVGVLILYNDEINSFDHVISSLISVCNHDSTQAYQCAMIAHLKGECDVKTGDLDYLVNLKQTLIDRGLTAVVKEA